MSFPLWLRGLKNRVVRSNLPGNRAKGRLNRHMRRPVIEQLEDRLTPSATSSVLASYGALSMSFEANHGQTDSQVAYLARGDGYALFLTPTESVMSLRTADGSGNAVLRTHLNGANSAPQITG